MTESWLTSNDSITIADLTNSLEDYAVYHLPRSTRRGGGLAVIARQGLHLSRNKGCILSSFKHFDLTITSGDKVYRLVTVYRPQPFRMVFLRILCVLRVVNFYILSILFVVISTFTSMTTQMQTPNNFLTFFFSADLSSPIQAHWERALELVAEM